MMTLASDVVVLSAAVGVSAVCLKAVSANCKSAVSAPIKFMLGDTHHVVKDKEDGII